MTFYRELSGYVESPLLAILAVGLLVRGRAALCWSFGAYAVTVLASNSIIAAWPDSFDFTHYVVRETVLMVLKALIAVEIWWRTFSSLPRARPRVGSILVGAFVLAGIASRAVPPGLDAWTSFVGVVNPRLQMALLLCYAVVASAAWWFRAPLHSFHRAVLFGFATYLVLHTVGLSYHGWQGSSDSSAFVNWLLDATMYPVALILWSWAAWRPLRAPSPILSRLQPWAHSS
jgi:hypothetical protein